MEPLELYCAGERCGQLVFRPEGGRTEVRASMWDPGDGLYRAALLGERGECPLGVLAPEEGRLTLSRKLYNRDIAALGRLLRGEARRSFLFQEAAAGWLATEHPAQLFHQKFLQIRLQRCGSAWWRKEGERLLLALPLEEGRPFPLETLFCLAEVTRVEGRLCVVYQFSGDEPQLPG